jgi:hypothetical protein
LNALTIAVGELPTSGEITAIVNPVLIQIPGIIPKSGWTLTQAKWIRTGSSIIDLFIRAQKPRGQGIVSPETVCTLPVSAQLVSVHGLNYQGVTAVLEGADLRAYYDASVVTANSDPTLYCVFNQRIIL